MNRFAGLIILGAFAATAGSAFASSKKKTSYQAAKKECLREDSRLKGPSLRKCILKKRK